MHRVPLALAVLIALAPAAVAQPPAAPSPATRAERSDYTETSTHRDVLDFLGAIATDSAAMELRWMGTSVEGRRIPLVIVAPPHLRTPTAAHASGRLVCFVQANIHAGEVEGKEACQMLLREIAGGAHAAWREHLVLLVAPIYNTDGNERISPRHRRQQVGPPGGVGVRPNAQNLDLNRDYMKAVAPETRASLALFRTWDPHVLLDLHTTNGSKHRWALTYAASNHPNADRTVQTFVERTLLPEVSGVLRPDYETFFYGNFVDARDPAKGWATFGWEGRFCSNYYGLRNRVGILVEAYAYRDFRTRVDVTRRFVAATLDRCVTHKDRIRTLTRDADARASRRAADATFAVDIERCAWDEPQRLLGYEVTEASMRRGPRPTDEDRPKDYVGPCYLGFAAKRSTAVPAGYAFGPGLADVADHLARHGVRVYRLTGPKTIAADACRIREIDAADRLFQGVRLQKATVDVQRIELALETGSFWVPTAQPLGRLAIELLDPEVHDGLLAWGLLDRHLAHQWSRARVTAPIYRCAAPIPGLHACHPAPRD